MLKCLTTMGFLGFGAKGGIKKVGKVSRMQAVDGGEGTVFHEDRKDDIVRAVLGHAAVDLTNLALDNGRKGKKGGAVSLEGLAGDTLDRQAAIDKAIEAENNIHGMASETKVPPCKLVKRLQAEGEMIKYSRGSKIEGE